MPVRFRTASAAIGGTLLAALFTVQSLAQAPDPVVYTIRFPDTAARSFTVEAVVPSAARRESIDVMMPVWSPGFYGLQNYADRVTSFAAKGADGVELAVAKSAPNRWTITTGGRA